MSYMNTPVGIPSGWEEIIAYHIRNYCGLPYLIHLVFTKDQVEQVPEYYLDEHMHDWRVVE